MELDYVYHGSRKQRLTEIRPYISSHGEKWVYAIKDIVFAATFISTVGGDFTCSIDRDSVSGKPYICERFQGAFDLRYAGVKGSIYILPISNFIKDKTDWKEEIVSYQSITPIGEIRIVNAKKHLVNLASAGNLIIKYYPEKIVGIPMDDRDLLQRALTWYKLSSEETIEQVKQYHPNLLQRILEAIDENIEEVW